MTAGDMLRGEGLILRQMLAKTTTAITKGEMLVYDTDGLAQAGADADGPHYMSPETHAAPASGQTEFSAVKEGDVQVKKAAGTAIPQAAYVKCAASGAITLWANTDDAWEIVGYAIDAAATAAVVANICLGGR